MDPRCDPWGPRPTGVFVALHDLDATMDVGERSVVAEPDLALVEGVEAPYREQLMS